jgi:hypothetical protein
MLLIYVLVAKPVFKQDTRASMFNAYNLCADRLYPKYDRLLMKLNRITILINLSL